MLNQLKPLLPEAYQAIFLGDGEFGGLELQAAVQALDWPYVCRTAKNTQLYEDGEPFSFADLLLRPGDCVGIPNVQFTHQAYGPVTVIGWWKRGFKEPIPVSGTFLIMPFFD